MYLSDDVKKELVDKITKVTKVKKIILFGSYSKGTATDESDIDLLIIENEINSKIEEKRKIMQCLKSLSYSKDILVISQEEYDFYKNDFCSVVYEACRQGEFLWNT